MKKLILSLAITAIIVPSLAAAATCNIHSNTMRNGRIRCNVKESHSEQINITSDNKFEQTIKSITTSGGNTIKAKGDVTGATIKTGDVSSSVYSSVIIGTIKITR